jgi:cAMP-dependent protein kinase regulator
MIVKAFTGPLNKPAGEDIIVQGDIGDMFYLLEDGSVDVYVRKAGEEHKVHTYKPGDAFGELALMYNAPRAATCRAHVDCKLWALDRVSFKVIVVAAAMHKRETYQGFLSKVPILQTLTEMEIMTLADSLAEESYTDGEIICSQGDEGDYFYIVKDGTALCSQVDAAGKDKIVATLNSGMYFGEIALLTTKPRQATVRAQGHLNVLSLDRATFTRIFGNLDELMKRNMEQYNKYAAATI